MILADTNLTFFISCNVHAALSMLQSSPILADKSLI